MVSGAITITRYKNVQEIIVGNMKKFWVNYEMSFLSWKFRIAADVILVMQRQIYMKNSYLTKHFSQLDGKFFFGWKQVLDIVLIFCTDDKPGRSGFHKSWLFLDSWQFLCLCYKMIAYAPWKCEYLKLVLQEMKK